MPDYRAYVVGSDGHFVSFEGFVARDDAEAIEQAKRVVNRFAVELWSGKRLVRKYDPKEPD
jgi:hypothetical protein